MLKQLSLVAAAALVVCGCSKKADDTLVMITESGFAPYEYMDGGTIVGVDVDICQAIADKLGKKLVVQDAKFDAVIPSVIAGKADIAAAGITVTEDRKQSVDFSIPYVKSGIVIISRKDAPVTSAEECKGKKVGVQSGTTSDTFCVDVMKQEPERFDNPPIAVAALKSGKIDCVIADVDPAKNCVKGDDSVFISSDFVGEPEEFAVAIKKGQPELLAAINEVIQSLVDAGAIEASKAKHDAAYAALRGAEEAAEAAETAVDAAKDTAEKAVDAVKDTAEKAVDVVKDTAEKAVDAVKDAADKAAPAVEKAVDAVKDTAEKAVDAVKDTAENAGDAIKEAVDKVAE